MVDAPPCRAADETGAAFADAARPNTAAAAASAATRFCSDHLETSIFMGDAALTLQSRHLRTVNADECSEPCFAIADAAKRGGAEHVRAARVSEIRIRSETGRAGEAA